MYIDDFATGFTRTITKLSKMRVKSVKWRSRALALSLALVLHVSPTANGLGLHPSMPLLPPGLAMRLARADTRSLGFVNQAAMVSEGRDAAHRSKAGYRPYILNTPISHFEGDERYEPHVDGHFGLRYWLDDRYYEPDVGPVLILLGGETSGDDRLPFLKSGILPLLAKPTHGLSIVLEHRYYGESIPVDDFSTDNLRFLDTAQSLADIAYFIQHAELPNIGRISNQTMVIVYGGSYAGAQAAFVRKLYPHLVHGAFASSAVTTAIYDYWRYFEPIRINAPGDCVETITESISIVDALISLNDSDVTHTVKTAFGLPNVTDDRDFANVLAIPLGFWQAKNWDKEVDNPLFDYFCEALRKPMDNSSMPLFDNLPAGLQGGGALRLGNYARFSRDFLANFCNTEDQDECFATHNPDTVQQADVSQVWRPWFWQTCTEWGYFMSHAPLGVPSLVSRHVTLAWVQDVCPIAFPPGNHTRVPENPDIDRINQWGNFTLAMDRLAFIDGSIDPWLTATPHSVLSKPRKDSLSQPFKLIHNGVHHWDENARSDGHEPPEIRKIHAQELAFVHAWLEEWKTGL